MSEILGPLNGDELTRIADLHYRGLSFENSPNSDRVPGFSALWRITEFYTAWKRSDRPMALILDEFGSKQSDTVATPQLVQNTAEALLYESGRTAEYDVTKQSMLHSNDPEKMFNILMSPKYFYTDVGGIRVPAITDDDKKTVSAFLTSYETLHTIHATPLPGLLWVETNLNLNPGQLIQFGLGLRKMHRLIGLNRKFANGIDVQNKFIMDLADLLHGRRQRLRYYENELKPRLGLGLQGQLPDVEYRIQGTSLRRNTRTTMTETRTVAYPREVSAIAKLPFNKVLVLYKEYWEEKPGSDSSLPLVIHKPTVNFQDLWVVNDKKWSNYLDLMRYPIDPPSEEDSIIPYEFALLESGSARMFPSAF